MSIIAAGRNLLVVAAFAAGVMMAGGAQARHTTGGGVHVRVDVGEQMMEVYVDGELQHRWKVSTGRSGFETPGGTFRPQRLERDWHSRKYDDAPMPHAVFFEGGYAIHGTTDTRHLGRQASHGCIRLHPDHAEELYDLVQEHGARRTRIQIDD